MTWRWSSSKRASNWSRSKVAKRGRLLTLIAILPLLCYVYPSPARAGRVAGRVEVGFDSFTEKYSLIEEDTTDGLSEFRTRINLGYLQGRQLADYFELEGETLIGEASFENSGRFRFLRGSGRSRLGFNSDLTYRSFRDNSVYAFANDYLRYSGRVFAERRTSRYTTVRLTDSFELMNFDRRTQFDYDYLRNSISVSGEYDRDFISRLHGYLTYTGRSVPDSTEIGYKGYTMGLELRRAFGLNRQIYLTANAHRRIFAHKPTKSPYWSIFSTGILQPITLWRFGLTIDNTLESYLYDEETAAFFSYLEDRTALMVFYYQGFDFRFGMGPTFGIFVSDFSEQDEYSELGAKVSVEWSLGPWVWLSGTYEPAWRDYRLDAVDPTEIIFSDFVTHRLLAFVTVRPSQRTSVNLFVDHEPQSHDIEDDDSTTTLFSLDVAYSF